MGEMRGRWALGFGVMIGLTLGGAAIPKPAEAGLFAWYFATSTSQSFHQADPPQVAPVFTVQCNTGVWNNTNHIRIIIPPSLNLTWNTLVGSITPGGPNGANLSGAVNYAFGNKIAVVTVTTSFSSGQQATISGLQFASPGAPSSGTLGAAYSGSLATTPDAGMNDKNGNTITIVGNPTLSSGSPQTLAPPGPVAANTMTVTDAATPGIWSSTKLRIIIPAGLSMQWDTTIQKASDGVSITGSAAGFVTADGSGNLVTYPSATVALVNVTTTFPSGGQILIAGLKFTTIVNDSGPLPLYLDTNGSLFDHADDSFSKTILGLPTLSSASSQLYTVQDPSTSTPVFSIASSPGSPSKITLASGIQLVIPAGLHMSWDQTIHKPADGLAFGGSASGLIGPDGSGNYVTYPSAQIALINVITSDFPSNATLTVSGLKFTTFTAASLPQQLTMDTTAAQVLDNQTYGIGAPTITDASLAPGQVFTVNANPAATLPCADITVSDDPSGDNRITGVKGIRIRIPGAPSLTWDTSVTAVTFPAGTATGHMQAGPNVTYEDLNRTAVIAVASDFSGAGQTVSIHGLGFQNFTLPQTPISLRLGVNGPISGGGTNCASDNRILAIGGVPSIASAANQAFSVNDPLTATSQITVTDAAGFPSITTTNGITINIPPGFPMQWDTTIQKSSDGLVFGGSAAGNVGPDGSGNIVTYTGGLSARINVKINFGAGDTLVVTGLKFNLFTAPHASDTLQLFVDPLGSAVLDPATIGIGQPTIVLAASQVFGVADAPTALGTLTVTEDASVPRIQSGPQIRVHIPPGLAMSWDTTIQKTMDGLVFGGSASGRVNPDGSGNVVTYPDPRTALINVTSNFGPGETLTVDGLKGANFTAPSGPLGLTLEVNNLGTSCSTTPQTLAIGTRAQLVSAPNAVITADLNGNGSIDRLILTFDKPILGTTSSVTTGHGFTIQNPSYTIAAGSASGSVVTFVLVERGVPDTGATPTLVYDATVGNLQDTTGLTVRSIAGAVAQDGAPPVVVGVTTADPDGNGHLDTVTITWSEPLLAGQENISDWKLIDADGSTNLLQGLTSSSMSISGNKVIFTLSNTTGTDGTPRFLYTPSTAPTIKDQSAPAPNAAVQQTNARPPVASAGVDFSSYPSKVMLDATGSRDPNGQSLIYSWVQTAGNPIWTLDNPTLAQPSFLATKDGVYTFQVTVSDLLLTSVAVVNVTIIKVAPGADPGSPQTIVPGEFPVYLEALGSSDANGNPLTFTWTQIGGAPGIPDPPTPLIPGVAYFTAPTPSGSLPPNNILTFQIAVSDGTNVTTNQVLVRLNGTSALAPTADAGPNLVAYVGSTVQLDGGRSFDPQGGALTYAWSSTVPMGSPTTATPTFVPNRPGIYTFTLSVVNLANLESLPSTVQVMVQTPTNQAPVAVAQKTLPAGEIAVGDLVVLDGSGSVDPEGTPLTYAWTQTAGAKVILTNPGSVQSSFYPVIPGTYSFQLVVSDGVNLSYPSPVSFTVKALPASITWTTTLGYGAGIDPVTGHANLSAGTLGLTATTSDNSPSNFWFYAWSQTGGPTLNFGSLSFVTPMNFMFTPTVAGSYTFQVAATTRAWAGTDNISIRAYATIGVVVDDDISVPPHPVPVAVAGPAQNALAGQAVTLNAGGSTGTGVLVPIWSQIAGPPVVLSNPEGTTPTFTPVAAGTYTFQLKVADATTQSPPATVTITVNPAPAPPAQSSGKSGGCGFTGSELLLLLPLLWRAHRGRRRSGERG